jgi:large subunit ribosomal protein L3
MQGHFARADVPPLQYLEEFKVSPEAMLPIGTKLYAQHFVPGQWVDVRGVTYVIFEFVSIRNDSNIVK